MLRTLSVSTLTAIALLATSGFAVEASAAHAKAHKSSHKKHSKKKATAAAPAADAVAQ